MFFFNFLWPKHALSFDKNEDKKKQINATKKCLNNQKKNQNDIVLDSNFYTQNSNLAQIENFTLKEKNKIENSKMEQKENIKHKQNENFVKEPYFENKIMEHENYYESKNIELSNHNKNEQRFINRHQDIEQKDYNENEVTRNEYINKNTTDDIENNLINEIGNKNIIISYENKINQLKLLKEKMEKEEGILFKKFAKNFVFSDGNVNSSLMFIAEAPGEEEDLQGVPFVGKSGKLLRELLKKANILDFYIINVLPWRPPMNRTPSLDEISIMRPYIFEHIRIISPKIIVSVGTTALRALLIEGTITALQNTIIKTQIGLVFPIYHPSYALRIYSKKLDLFDSLIHLKSILDNN